MEQHDLTEWMDTEIRFLNPLLSGDGRIGEFLARGSFGFVCSWQDSSREDLVVKILDVEYVRISRGISDPLVLKSLEERNHYEFQRAVLIHATKCPNLMRISSGTQTVSLEERTVYFIVMPRMKTLEDLSLPGDSQEKANQALRILTDCFGGLSVLHEEAQKIQGLYITPMQSMVHGDIKPDNIFVRGEREVSGYVLGDFGESADLASIKGMENPVNAGNPYAAPGVRDETGDFWSLGWVLWYWMNGKKHPGMAEVDQRTKGTLGKSPGFEGEPELWDVFWKLTEPDPGKRMGSVDKCKKALQDAADTRSDRLKRKSAKDAVVTENVLLLAIAAALKIFNRSGTHQGKVRREAELACGGTFKGTWENNLPVKGTYTSPSRKVWSGNWQFWEQGKTLKTDHSSVEFAGLVSEDKGQLIQGNILVSFRDAVRLEGRLLDGECIEGVLTLPDGRKKNGKWKYFHDEFRNGLTCAEQDPSSGWVNISLSPELGYYGCIFESDMATGTIYTPNVDFSFSNVAVWKRAWPVFYGFYESGCRFNGTWNREGFPEKGTFTFGSGECVKESFGYAEDQKGDRTSYTGMVLEGKPWGYGILTELEKEIECRGEFKAGVLHGRNTLKFLRTDTCFYGLWVKNALQSGTLVFKNGKRISSEKWTAGIVGFGRGTTFEGLLCLDSQERYQGIGRLLIPSTGYRYEGEVCDGDFGEGTFYDSSGSPVSREQVLGERKGKR